MDQTLASSQVARAGDQALLDRIRQRDAQAFGELIEAYSYILLRLATAITGNPDTARDIVQDVFMHIWTAEAALDIRGDVRGYLWTATRNRARKLLRHESVRERFRDWVHVQEAHQSSAALNTAIAALDAEDLARQVHAGLAGVAPRCREIFLLYWRDELTIVEIADLLHIGIPTVRNQIGRAMRTLVQHFRDLKHS